MLSSSRPRRCPPCLPSLDDVQGASAKIAGDRKASESRLDRNGEEVALCAQQHGCSITKAEKHLENTRNLLRQTEPPLAPSKYQIKHLGSTRLLNHLATPCECSLLSPRCLELIGFSAFYLEIRGRLCHLPSEYDDYGRKQRLKLLPSRTRFAGGIVFIIYRSRNPVLGARSARMVSKYTRLRGTKIP